MIIGKKLEGFDNQLNFDKLNYPQFCCGLCPKFHWNMLNIGSRGSGKTYTVTYTVCQMLKHYEKHKIMKDGIECKLRRHVMSPTIQGNERCDPWVVLICKRCVCVCVCTTIITTNCF